MRWRVTAVVVLTVLAGCSGALDRDPTPTVTPVDVPDLGSDRTRYPPGLAETGIGSSAALADGHAGALAGNSYTWNVRKCRASLRNGSVVDRECGADRISFVDATTYRWNHTAGPGSENTPQFEPGSVRDSYANGTFVFRRFRADGRVWYERDRASGQREGFSFMSQHFVQQYLAVNRSTVDRVERDGEIVYRVVGSDHRVPRYSRSDDYRVVALVEPSGLVLELRATYSRTYGDLTMRTTVRSVYRDVGTTAVEAPRWLEDARENVTTDG